jgi:hypothetical protein
MDGILTRSVRADGVLGGMDVRVVLDEIAVLDVVLAGGGERRVHFRGGARDDPVRTGSRSPNDPGVDPRTKREPISE